ARYKLVQIMIDASAAVTDLGAMRKTNLSKNRWWPAVLAVICLLLPFTAFAGAPTISYIQGNYATPQSAQVSVAVKFNSPQTAGNLNVVVVGWNDSTATVSSVTDSSGN